MALVERDIVKGSMNSYWSGKPVEGSATDAYPADITPTAHWKDVVGLFERKTIDVISTSANGLVYKVIIKPNPNSTQEFFYKDENGITFLDRVLPANTVDTLDISRLCSEIKISVRNQTAGQNAAYSILTSGRR